MRHSFYLILFSLTLGLSASFSMAEGYGRGGFAVEDIPALPPLATAIDLTQDTEALWERIRNGFAMPDLNDERVLTFQQWYSSRPAFLRRMVERSRPYLYHIVSELERRNMPTELALLPMVESAFDPHALSRAQAAGLWQFIPSTGKNYNLNQNWWEDERRDIIASTNAALDYLQAIYEMHGDWHLALASYNWGEGAVKRAIAKNVANGLATDFSSLKLPAETRNYVPKLQALKNIFGNPATLTWLTIPEIPNRPFFKRVTAPAPIDAKLAAQLAGMTLKDFQALNPSLNRPVIRDRSFLIPADNVENFEASLREHDAPLQTWNTYTAQRGDKLDELAKRYNLPVPEFRRINSLGDKNKLTPGQTLVVPSRDNHESADTAKDWKTLTPPPPAPAAAASPANKGKGKLAESSKHDAQKTSKSKDARGASSKDKKQAPSGKAVGSSKADSKKTPRQSSNKPEKSSGKGSPSKR